jgi:hypothetical protein
MRKQVIQTYHFIVNAGVDENDPLQKQYRTRSINKFCLFCILISSPYLVIFLLMALVGPFWLFLGAHCAFSSVIIFNYHKKYNAGNLLFILNTALSVSIISFMLGFDSGFHLYLYTAPLFIFWLFSIYDIKNIILSFIIYTVVYGLTILNKYYYPPFYKVDFGFDIYSLNMILNLVLLFFVFYNYSAYYKILEKSLIQKQTLLEEEIEKRNDSESNIKKLFTELYHSY